MKILIPTCKPADELAHLREDILRNSPGCEVFMSCLKASASVNRNACLDQIHRQCDDGAVLCHIAIMIDDDIEGFYPGWVDDMIRPFSDPNVVMVSARLLNDDCTFGPTCSGCIAAEPLEIEVRKHGNCVLPTAAIAFQYRGIRFDENFLGSGWEDNDWCLQYLEEDPECKFIQSNRCQLIHKNEMKNQKGSYWKHNVMYFHTKWSKRDVAV